MYYYTILCRNGTRNKLPPIDFPLQRAIISYKFFLFLQYFRVEVNPNKFTASGVRQIRVTYIQKLAQMYIYCFTGEQQSRASYISTHPLRRNFRFFSIFLLFCFGFRFIFTHSNLCVAFSLQLADFICELYAFTFITTVWLCIRLMN